MGYSTLSLQKEHRNLTSEALMAVPCGDHLRGTE
jgi:hypothetical protein